LKSEQINAKSFMEFFENQYGVKFVDSSTGEKALDLIIEKEKNDCDNMNENRSNKK